MVGAQITAAEVYSSWISRTFYPVILKTMLSIAVVIISGTPQSLSNMLSNHPLFFHHHIASAMFFFWLTSLLEASKGAVLLALLVSLMCEEQCPDQGHQLQTLPRPMLGGRRWGAPLSVHGSILHPSLDQWVLCLSFSKEAASSISGILLSWWRKISTWSFHRASGPQGFLPQRRWLTFLCITPGAPLQSRGPAVILF